MKKLTLTFCTFPISSIGTGELHGAARGLLFQPGWDSQLFWSALLSSRRKHAKAAGVKWLNWLKWLKWLHCFVASVLEAACSIL
jgi:hypothetical protein